MEERKYAYPKIKGVEPSHYIDAYNLVLECSNEHTPRSFSVRLLECLKTFCPYDKAVVMFFDTNGRYAGCHTVGIEQDYIKTFIEYYADIGPPEFNIFDGKGETSGFEFSRVIDWSTFPDNVFKREYLAPLNLKYSWGFCFFDLLGKYRVVFSLDRTRDEPFSQAERDRLNLALPVLNNMHRNFFYRGVDARTREGVSQSAWQQYGLTAREEEIATLLCQGMTAQNISSVLYIAITTTYKHIANIFKKTNVNNQRELIVKLLENE